MPSVGVVPVCQERRVVRDEHQAVAPRRVENPSHAPVDLRRILATEPEERPVDARPSRLANVIVIRRLNPPGKWDAATAR